MRIAVLSGKGGAGKTLVAVNLAVTAEQSVYIDCDVEEPNGRLFLKPIDVEKTTVNTRVPKFDENKCIGCKKCVEFCNFNALIYIKKKPMVFNDVCHSCGGCMLVCPTGAIDEQDRPIGHIEKGTYKGVSAITGVLNTGESSGIHIIQKAQKMGFDEHKFTVIDCPPGSACSVMESVEHSDYCILVAEPTAFGFHNFKMVYELVTLLNKPCGVVINKEDENYLPLEEFCEEHDLEILEKIPYNPQVASIVANGGIASEQNEEMKEIFKDLYNKVRGCSQ